MVFYPSPTLSLIAYALLSPNFADFLNLFLLILMNNHCGLVVSTPTWDGTGCEFDSWQCRIYIPCSLSLRLLGSLWGSLGTYGLTQKLCLKKNHCKTIFSSIPIHIIHSINLSIFSSTPNYNYYPSHNPVHLSSIPNHIIPYTCPSFHPSPSIIIHHIHLSIFSFFFIHIIHPIHLFIFYSSVHSSILSSILSPILFIQYTSNYPSNDIFQLFIQ